MLLQSYPNNPSILPKTLPSDQSPPFLLFSFPLPYPKSLSLRYRKSSKFLIRSSGADSRTLPKSAIQRIADRLRSLGYVDHQDPNPAVDPEIEAEPKPVRSGSAGEIFVPLRQHLPKYRVGHTIDSSWSLPENPVPAPGSGNLITRFYELSSEVKEQSAKKHEEERKPTLAQLTLPKREIRRLQGLGIGIKNKLKIGKAGITEGIVNSIHDRWRHSELVKIVCEDLCKLNMQRTHDVLEVKRFPSFVLDS